MTNFPALLTCAVPISASASMIFEHADFFISIAVASASATPPLDSADPVFVAFFIAVTLFIAFIAFMGAITAN